MTILHKQLDAAKTPTDFGGHSAPNRRHPPAADQIDQLVYELYGLTDACPPAGRNEIRIVEEGTQG